jgi:glycosyltransferase involved in cell wall biosynthesis
MIFCFYGSGIYDSLIGNPPGGAELQVALIAKALSENGHKVTVIDNGKRGKNLEVGGIMVKFTSKTNLKVVRFFFEKIPNSIRYLFAAKADFYYIRGFSMVYTLVLLSTWKLRSKLILGMASDMDVLSFIERFKYVFQNKISLFNWIKNDLSSSIAGELLLRKSNYILTQHLNQQVALQSRTLDSSIFPNIILPEIEVIIQEVPDYFIYVGSLNERKGLSDLLHFISKLDDIKIKIFGSIQGKKAVNDSVLLNNYKNITYSGQKQRKVIIHEIANSRGLLNFSKMEGFPNTFLEAWQLGVPVFSLWVDPGGVIQKHNLGKCFNGDINMMAAYLNDYGGDMEQEHLKKYVENNHAYTNAADRLMDIIKETP